MTSAEVLGLLLSAFALGYAASAIFLFFRKLLDYV
jgi:hypothetical protein